MLSWVYMLRSGNLDAERVARGLQVIEISARTQAPVAARASA